MINSDIAEVVVVPDPTVSTQPLTTQTICVGGTIPTPLNVAYTGGVGTPTYQWFITPASSIAGATSNSYTPPVYSATGTFDYYSTISLSGSGCDALTSANATVIVIADPIVSAQPTTTQSVCQNTATSQLSVSITGGTGTASYQWYSSTTNSNVGGTPIAGATLNTYTPSSTVVGTQYYYCTITQTGTNCGVTSNPAAVVVNLAPVLSNQPISTQQHCLNQSTSPLEVQYANGTGTPTYQWYVNNNNTTSGGTPINLATSNTYSPPSNIDGTFYYYCIVSFTSGGGCPSITSNISEVIIHPYPIVTITGGETICLLESSDINFAFTPSSGLYDITYTANGQSVTIDNYNGANPIYTVTPTQTTTYVVTNIAYDLVPQCGIQPNTSIVVNVNPLPALNQPIYTFCSDVATTSLQYIPDANTYSYNWLPNVSANFSGQTNGPSSISVTLPDPLGNDPTDYYYVTSLTNIASGCQALDSILVTINPNPVGSFALPTTGCVDSPIALSNGDTTIGNYEWTIDGVLYSSSPNPAPPVFTSLGVYTIEMVAINFYGCTDTLNSAIQIYDLPVANFSTDINTGCAPLLVNFDNLSSGQFITNYEWTFAPDTVAWSNTFNSSSLINPPSVTYLQGDATATYIATLAVTNACGTVTTQQDITVLPTPVAAFTFATPTICSGSSLVINNISVGEPISYSWTFGNTISSNPNLQSMFFPSDSVTNVYPLTLTLTNACGTDTFIDSVTVLPDLINGGFITTADAGCSPLTVTFTNTTFNTNLSTVWYLDDPLNTVISNQNTLEFTYFATNNTSQNYNPYLVVTDGCASDTTFADLNVFANPLPIISASQINLCAGTTVNFSGTITGGDTGFGYNWDFGGLGTSNLSTTSFTFPAGSPSGLAIPITLTANSPTFSGTNCSNTTTTVINVYNNPDASAIAFNLTEGCSDLEVVVSNLPSATNQINWGDGTTNFNNTHIYLNNGPSLLTYPVEVNSTLTYGTIPALSCTTLTAELVSVYPTPLPQIFASAINVCEGDDIDFIASTANNQNTGITYLWDFGTMGTSNSANTTMTFDAGNETGLLTQVELTAFQNTSGTICSASITDEVVVYDTPDLTTATYSDVSNCSPLLVSITNLPTSTYLYNWGDGTTTSNANHIYFNQGTVPTTYNVTIDATTFYATLPMLACNATANQIVQVNPQPIAAFTINPAESCLYIPVNTTLQNTSINAVAPYVWNYNGAAYTTNSLNYIATFNTPGVQPIELIVSNQFGCTDSVSSDFIIYELPTVTLNAIDDNLCAGATTEFEVDGTGISTSIWDFGDGTILNLLSPTSLVHYYSQPGVYSITTIVTSVEGCTDTVTFQNEVIIHPIPTASFTVSSITADIVYPYFEFYDLSVGASNYYWNFGDSNWSNDVSPNHTYTAEGNYLVELTVTNEYNCTDIASQIVQVEGIVVYIPNAFTPLDYNGVNDVFKPSFSSTEGIEFYEFRIYDRWGIRLFQTNDIEEAWIGNSKQNESGDDNYYAQNDIYTYQIVYRKKARADDPQPDQIITGHVTIIR
jgi:PKD repeat protein